MSSNLYNVLSGIINNERGIITGLQNVKGTADRLNGIIVTSGDGTGFLADNGTYVNVGSQNLAPVVNGKIPAEYLPSYVDDVIEGYYRSNAFYATASGGSPMTGEAGKLYLDLTSNKNELYRWTGSAYVKVSGLNGDDLLAINNKISYVSGVVSGIHVYNSTVTFKNGSTSLGTLTTNQSSAGTVQLSGLVPTVGAGVITLKNGTKTSANTFTVNETGAKSVDIAALFSGYATGTINNKTVTFKNGSTTLGTLSTNQASNSEIQLSSMLNGIATTSNIPTVNDVTISFKNGSLTAADTFTTNASSTKAIQLSGILSGLALKSSIPTVNNKTVTLKNGSTTIGTLSTNQSANSEINFSGEFDKKQDVIDSSHKLDYSLISSQPTIPSVGNATITFKNGNTSLGSFTTNQSSAGTIQLSSLITTANGAIGDGTITLKNGSTSIGSFTVNQSDAKEINLSSEFNKKQNVIDSSHKLSYTLLSSTPTIPIVNNNTIILKNGSTTISSFTLNQNSDVTVDFGAEFNKKQNVINSSNKLAYSNISGTPSIYNSTITLVNGSTSGDSFTVNANVAKNVQLSALFAEYATNTDLNYVSGIVNGLQAQANPEGTIAAFGAMSGNIVTATANFSNGYFVTSNGTAKTVEGKTLSKVTSISSPTDSQIPTAKAVSSLVSGTINYVANSVSGKITTSDGTGTTAGNLVLTTGTNNKILSSSIASSKLVQSDGTGSTAGQVVVTTATGNKILSSDITAANIVQSSGTGTTANKLIISTTTGNNVSASTIGTGDLVQSAGTGTTSGKVVVTTTTGNKILSSNITAANIVTAASNMTSGKIVTANGNKTIEGATLTKVTSITSGRTDNDIPTAKAVYAYTSGAVNKVSANDTTITIKDTQANISDSFTTNTSSAKTIELSGMFAKRECLSAVFPTGATTTAVAGQWLIMMNSANATVNLPSSGSSGQFIKVTVTSTAINGTQVNIGGSIYGQNGGTWGSLGNPLAVDIPETLTFVFASSHWNLIETNRL